MMDQRIMSFGEHLDELRRRLVFALLGLLILFIAALALGGPILRVISAPLLSALQAGGHAPMMLATSPLEGFGAYLKVSTAAALLFGMPWILYQAWLFVAPGLYAREQRFVYFLMPLSVALTAVGVVALYFVILPVSLYFLINFGSGLLMPRNPSMPLPEGVVLPTVPVLPADPEAAPTGAMWLNSATGQLRVQVEPGRIMGSPLVKGGIIAQQYRISEYVSLVFMLGLAFALAFQLPMVLLLLSWAGLVRPEDLTRYRRQVLFGCVVGAAFLPTQDPWSLILLSALLYGLFEFGILLMRLVPARRVADGLFSDPARTRTDGDEEA